jgi:hypothetical protein
VHADGVVRYAWAARFILVRYMFKEKEKNLPVLDARRPWLANIERILNE